MLPATSKQNFPMFVPDQVLTSDNLNQLFTYLDTEGRMTRTNLIGIGIVCGLEIKQGIDASGQYIIITKGVGVTSHGYLISVPEIKYHKFQNYDAVQCRYYEPFVTISSKIQKFPLWELKEFGETTGTSALNIIPGGLSDKVVMLFVEQLKTTNKNCDPNSCDDKGKNVTVRFKPLLVNKANAMNLISTGSPGVTGVSFNGLKDLLMPRWDVPDTNPVTSDDIINGYRKILTPAFVQNIQNTLSDAYNNVFKPLVIHEYPANPFATLTAKFSFLGNPSLTPAQTVHIQYYYDFFSDLMQAYEEFCKTGKELISVCCPDETLFPRHLLLGEAVPLPDSSLSSFRHKFIYSPLFECRNLIYILRTLFRRMDLMIKSVDVTLTSGVGGASNNDANLKVTPSQLGSMPLSVKAIPYYYNVNTADDSLHKFWSVEKKLRNRTQQTLSYNANKYNTADDFVLNPLKYDLEPHNFLRIEGVVGKNITGVLTTVQKRIKDNRLPVQVVILRTGTPFVEGFNPKNMGCNIQDLETAFDIIRREWEAVIGKTIEYLDDNKAEAQKLIDDGHPNQLQNFMQNLHLSKTYIEDVRENLPAFAAMFAEFILVYERIEDRAEKIRNQLMNMINDKNEKGIDILLAEDIIDHMDEVEMSCRKGGFRAIYQEYMKRLEEMYAKMFFTGYAKQNPGLQHKAGVTVGGTYILVYHDKPEPTNLVLTDKMKASIKKGPFTLQGTVTDKKGNPLVAASVQEKGAVKTVTRVNGKFTLALVQLPTVLIVKATGFDEYQEILFSPDKKKDIELEATIVPSAGVAALKDGDVIADFYLPYTCCSDCAPVQFVIQEPPPNRPPVARAGDNVSTQLPDNVVTLDGTKSSDPDENIVSYAWTYKSGPAQFLIDNPNIAKTEVRNLVAGDDYVFTLTVTDAEGKSSIDEVRITVLPAPNQAPVVDAGTPKQVTLPNKVTLVGTANDPDGSVTKVEWTAKAGNPAIATIASKNALTTDITFTKDGPYVFILTATDDKNKSASDEVIVTVLPAPNQLPVAVAAVDKPTITLPDNSVVLSAQGSHDPDGGPVTLLWSKSPATAPGVITKSTEEITTVTGLAAGSYTFTVTVKDDENTTKTASVNVTVNRQLAERNCGSLPAIGNAFSRLREVDIDAFGTFTTEVFNSYDAVQDYFKLMSTIVDLGTDKHVEFFDKVVVNGLGTEQSLQKWLTELIQIFKQPNSKQFHLLALALYRILVRLAIYIACIQDGDVNNTTVPMLNVLVLIKDHLGTFTTADVANMNEELRNIFRSLKALFEAALQNLTDSGEITKKPTYGGLLNSLIEVLTALGF